jgi:hypothetical protein
MSDLVRIDPMKQAELLAASTLVPDAFRGKPANVYLALMFGEALGIHAATALSSIVVVKGKPTMSAELMRALVQQHGHRFRIESSTATEAVVICARKEWPEDTSTFTFTMEDAQLAGLAGSDTYKKHPKSMLLARVTTMACRAMFADVIAGISYTPDELEPTIAQKVQPADVWVTPAPAPAIEMEQQEPIPAVEQEAFLVEPTAAEVSLAEAKANAANAMKQIGFKTPAQMFTFMGEVVGFTITKENVTFLDEDHYREITASAIKQIAEA